MAHCGQAVRDSVEGVLHEVAATPPRIMSSLAHAARRRGDVELLPIADGRDPSTASQGHDHAEALLTPNAAAAAADASGTLGREQLLSKLLKENSALTSTIAELEVEIASGSRAVGGRGAGCASAAADTNPADAPDGASHGGLGDADFSGGDGGAGCQGGGRGASATSARSPKRLSGFQAWLLRKRAGDRARDRQSLLERLERQRTGWGLIDRFREREAKSRAGSRRQSRDSIPADGGGGGGAPGGGAHPHSHSEGGDGGGHRGGGHSRGVGPLSFLRELGERGVGALGEVEAAVRGRAPHVAYAGSDEEADTCSGPDEDATTAGIDLPAASLPTFESYDYVASRSRVRQEAEQAATAGHKAAADREALLEIAFSGVGVPVLLGVAVGAAAYLSNAASNFLIDLKWDWTFALLHGGLWGLVSFPVFATLCVGFTAVAASVALFAPAACGSGIPHIKAVLNGIRVPGALSARTLAVKFVGITLVVASGLPAGREGPMVQIGAAVAALVLRFHSAVLGHTCCDHSPLAQTRLLDEDAYKRDFVSMGAAAGVAAAFNAPIGGVLFALEEVSTHWSQRLTSRSFFAAIIAAVTMNYLVSGRKHGVIEDDALVVFGEYDLGSAFEVRELPVFVLIGGCGGLLGALFNALNGRLNRWRQRAHAPRGALVLLAGGSRARAKVLEAAALALLCATLSFFLPLLFGCSDASTIAAGGGPPDAAADAAAGGDPIARSGGRVISVQSLLVSVQCTAQGEYNEIASITLSNQHRVVRALFSRRATGALFSTRTLGLCLLLNFFLAVVVYGCAIPSGLFIPCMTIGALGGRLIGELIASQESVAAAAEAADAVLRNFTADESGASAAAAEAARAAAAAALATADTGFYALVGAAAMLGGVTRMTISLTVIICEISNDAGALLPLMATILTAKVVGDCFNPSIYDAAMALAGFPFLEHAVSRQHQGLTAEEVMSPDVVALPVIARARDVRAVLAGTVHGAFPVIDPGRTGRCKYLTGSINRHELWATLQCRAFHRPGDIPPVRGGRQPSPLQRAHTSFDEAVGAVAKKSLDLSVDSDPFARAGAGGEGGIAARGGDRSPGPLMGAPIVASPGGDQGGQHQHQEHAQHAQHAQHPASGSGATGHGIGMPQTAGGRPSPACGPAYEANYEPRGGGSGRRDVGAPEPLSLTPAQLQQRVPRADQWPSPQVGHAADASGCQRGAAALNPCGEVEPARHSCAGLRRTPEDALTGARGGDTGVARANSLPSTPALQAAGRQAPEPPRSARPGQPHAYQLSPPPSPRPPKSPAREPLPRPRPQAQGALPRLPPPPPPRVLPVALPAPPLPPPSPPRPTEPASAWGGAREAGAVCADGIAPAGGGGGFGGNGRLGSASASPRAVTLNDLMQARKQLRRRTGTMAVAGGGRFVGGGGGAAMLRATASRLFGAAAPPCSSADEGPPPVPEVLEDEADMLVDLRPVMELSPMSVLHTTPLERLHNLFRSMGLRHLFVTDTRNQLIGVITRKDLLPQVLEEAVSSAPGGGNGGVGGGPKACAASAARGGGARAPGCCSWAPSGRSTRDDGNVCASTTTASAFTASYGATDTARGALASTSVGARP